MSASAKLSWRVVGMDCAACVAKITRAVERLPGVTDVEVNLMAERLTLARAADGAAPEAVERQVAALGYAIHRTDDADPDVPRAGAARLDHTDAHDHDQAHGHSHASAPPADADPHWASTPKARLVLVLGALVGAAFAASHLLPAWSDELYLMATLAALVPFGRRAVALARAGSPFSIETLMCVAAIGALVIDAAAEAALVVFLFAVGELLEGVAAGRARAGIKALVALMPREARRRRADGTFESVDAAVLRTDDVVQVRPGERAPCDGTILEGHSALDESPVTGESMPVARGPGDRVVAGSVNADAALLVRATAVGADGTLARIARLVESATAARGRTQRFIERFASVWTPAAMALALAVMLLPPLLADGDWSTWIYRGLAVLLVACPCALVISVPASMAAGLSAGARHGLLIKGGAALEAIGAAKTVAFDKTGTLTRGKPALVDVAAAPDVAEADLLAVAASIESGSSHPLAKAIVAAVEGRKIDLRPASGMTSIPGKGATAIVDGQPCGIGSPAWVEAIGRTVDPGLRAAHDSWEAEGKTVAVVWRGAKILGGLALRDEPRADAAEGIARLRAMGVNATVLTGDNARTGAAIAERLGMSVRAGLSPDDKLAAIAELKSGGVVAMVGDGINDAPALAAAHVGIAMGGGTAVALEAADAAIVKDKVTGVSELVRLSRDTLANVRVNVAIALGLKAVFLVTTVAGVTGLWPAILADTGATVLVTLNALRLLRWRPA